MNKGPGYPTLSMKYQAIPLAKLLDEMKISADKVVELKALDGFAYTVIVQRLLNNKKGESQAFLAVEPPDKKWPPLAPGKPSAGPFFVIWRNPELSQISLGEWPYQLAEIQVKGTLSQTYPKIIPYGPSDTKDPAVERGFALFTKTCFSCHTLNKQGAAHLGPDLNLPMNPTEYMQSTGLRRLIRDPRSVRSWPDSKMPGLDKAVLSDKDLDDLIAYLHHMAGRKP